MQLSRNAKGAIAFLGVIAIAHIWSAITPVYKPPWQPWPPIVPLMKDIVVPLLVNFYRPVLIGFSGLAVLWMWEGRREGFLVSMLLAAIAAMFGTLVTIGNALAQEWSGTFTAAITLAYPAIMAFWYSFQGYKNDHLETY
jgi:hypothetical protein